MREVLKVFCRCKQCSYTYTLELIEPYEREVCPVCGYKAELTEFNKLVREGIKGDVKIK